MYALMKSLLRVLTHRRCVFICVLLLTLSTILCYVCSFRKSVVSRFKNAIAGDIVDFTSADNVTGFGYDIVPNIVHYVHFESRKLSFIQVVSIRAVHLNHRPDKIMIHCNCHSLLGKYWDMVKNISNLELRFMPMQTHIFGQPLSSVYHSSDIARLKILMTHGGIFLDSDTYVVKSLDYYRKFEMTIGWPPGQNLGTQVLIAHKNARFLKLWYNSYRYYRREKWYYNAGELPTKMILEKLPYLVHRVPYDFGIHNLVHLLYGVKTDVWRDYHCIHLLVRHKNYLLPGDSVLMFDEDNIKLYNKTFGDMARLVIYGTEEYIQ